MSMIQMRAPGTDNVLEIPEEQKMTYQRLGFMYIGPAPEPAPEPKPRAYKKPKD